MNSQSLFRSALPLAVLFSTAALSASPINPSYTTTTVDGKTFIGQHVPSAPYKANGKNYIDNLTPDPPEYLASADDSLFGLLKSGWAQTAGWTFQNAAANGNLSDNSLNIVKYIAQVYTDIKTGDAVKVGAKIDVVYQPHGTDPDQHVHWIQFVTTNHPKGGQHGDPSTKVDTSFLDQIVPYYDFHGEAGAHYFEDEPLRPDVTAAHNWTAYLFLVTGPDVTLATKPGQRDTVTPGAVTILGGIKWGWEDHCTDNAPKNKLVSGASCPCECANNTTPEPATYALCGFGVLALVATRSRMTGRRLKG